MKKVTSLLLVALATIVNVAMASNVPNKKAPQTLKVDVSGSTVGWYAKKLTGDHSGTVKVKSGSLSVDGAKLVGGDFAIDMTTLADGGGNERLTNHLKSDDFFGVEKNPTATLKITKAVAKGGANFDVTGDLTIKGITQPITFPATVAVDATGKATASAKLEVDRTKFDIKFRSKTFFEDIGDKMIYDTFTLDVKIVASK